MKIKKINSRLLKEDYYYDPTYSLVIFDSGVIYTKEEIEIAKAFNDKEKKQVHAFKRFFDGKIIDTKKISKQVLSI